MEHHLVLNFVQRQLLVSIRFIGAVLFVLFCPSVSVMCLAVWIQIAILTYLVVILLFITDPEKSICVVTGLPAKYVFYSYIPYWPPMYMNFLQLFSVCICFIRLQIVNETDMHSLCSIAK